MRRAFLMALVAAGVAQPVLADARRGQQTFRQACIACHSLEPEKNMTGPSLSGVWHRKAGSLPGFDRYSPALKGADIVWSETTLDPWLTDPQAFIADNRMVFPGIADAQVRADLIEFLREATQPGAPSAGSMPDTGGMMGMGADVPNLKEVPPGAQVKAITVCRDTYTLTTADGQTVQFWERNLRFKTDTSADGPSAGSPALVGAGMVGDRASIIFAAPEEFGQFIKRECPASN